MPDNRRSGKKVPEYVRKEDSPGLRLDAGPYIGKIKNNLDPSMSGRLQVWIPDLGAGDEEDSSNWRTVSYASPFFGTTTQPSSSKENTFSNVEHTYGMWFTVPDLENLVLCTFVAGDPGRGFWFACIPNQIGHHMVPGIAGSKYVDSSRIESSTLKSRYKNNILPVVESNENTDSINWGDFPNLPKPIHEYQSLILQTQGLDRDMIRGVITSSSQRESPSTVFGISTPGRPMNDKSKDSAYLDRVKNGTATDSDYVIASRRGGHQFVMDDGDFKDKDRLIRLRTAGGHQLLMNDSEKILYIGNSNGSCWLEMTGSGHLNVYSANSISIRSQADLNFHADKDINMNAGGTFNVFASTAINLQSKALNSSTSGKTIFTASDFGMASEGTSITLTSAGGSFSTKGPLMFTGSTIGLNSGILPQFEVPAKITSYKLSDTGLDKVGLWQSTPGVLKSIVKIAPTHEPWQREVGTVSSDSTSTVSSVGGGSGSGSGTVTEGPPPTANIAAVECKTGTISTGSGGVLTDSTGKPVVSGPAAALDAGPKAASIASVKNPVNRSYFVRADNPSPPTSVGPLTLGQTKALMTQLAWNESGFNYSRVEMARGNYLGKYQIGAAVLTDQGYIKRDAFVLYGSKAVNYPTSWKNGVTSKEDFLANYSVQEQVMITLLKSNYSTLVRISGIKPGDDLCCVAGMLAVSHLLGAGGANTWRKTGAGADANNTTGATYFNMGRYAVDILAANT